MWTSDAAALTAADQHLCGLLGLAALRPEGRLYTRHSAPERWSAGMCKRLWDVHYQGWIPHVNFRLEWDAERQQEIAWREIPLREPPEDWQRGPQAAPLADPALLARLRQHIQDRLQKALHLENLVCYAKAGPPRSSVFEGELWTALPAEEILIRFNADTGDFLGWRHAAWFGPGESAGSAALDEEALRRTVEALPIFPSGMTRGDSWLSTDRPGHSEMLWTRSVQKEEVENDTLYACVNRFTGRVAECSLNWSPLIQELNLEPAAARESFAAAFARHFPGSIRCGMVRRMYVEIPGQAAKQRAWVANAIDTSGPVQIALGSGGALLRADSVT